MSDHLNNTNLNTNVSTVVSNNKLPNLNLESSLCFPKDIFYAPTFDVDAFLAHYKKEYSLERVRDDLNIFLKVLEMSMCELINKDYPDFVNLSTNLVDLDKAINDLKNPLETMKKDVDFVKNSIDSEIKQIMEKLNEKLMIEKRRIFLKLLMNWQRSLKVTNEMIGNSQKISGDHLERISYEFNQLKNSLSICSGENQDNLAQNNDINKLSQMLEKIMEDLFLKCLNLNEQTINSEDNESSFQYLDNKQQLRHVLKSYALLSKQRLAEQLFTENFVKPYLEKYINEEYLENNITKLNGVLDKVLEFLDNHSEFLRITNEIKSNALSHHTNLSHTSSSDLEELKNKNINSSTRTNEFDFLINSIWSSLVSSLDLNLNIIFSPADADQFHQNFNTSFEFLNKFESKCIQFDKQIKKKLYSSSSYSYFAKKWQIQVYYQIRFQEIVTKFEEDLITFLNLNSEFLNEDAQTMDLNPNAFYLIISDTLVKQMEFCWNESKCFLKCLIDRFWKLNLQLISRYCLFFAQLLENKLQVIQNNSNTTELAINTDQQQPRPKTPTETSNNQSLSEQTNDMNFFVYLLNDVNKLWSIKLPNFFDGVIAPVMRSSNALKDLSILKESFSCSLASLSELQSNLIHYLVKCQSEKCMAHLKNANDVPRLYRRTNREIPKAPSQYIGFAIQVIQDFKKSYSENSNKCSLRQKELIEKCLRSIIDIICSKYHLICHDLLESVKKMEDSLKRLQRVRQTNRSSANLTSQSTNLMSDDDKIRLQLRLDIEELGKQLEEKFDGYKGDSNFDLLNKLIDEIKSCLNKDKNNQINSVNIVNNNQIESTEQKQQNNTELLVEDNETAS